MVDALGGLEAFEIGTSSSGDQRIPLGFFGAMLADRGGVRVGNGKTAAAAGGGVMGTTGHGTTGLAVFGFIFSSRKSGGTPTPGGFCQRVRKHLKTKEMRFCCAQESAQG